MWYSHPVRLPHWSNTGLRRCAVHSITPPHGSFGVGVTGPVVSMLKPPRERADACGAASRAHTATAAKTNEKTNERIILDSSYQGSLEGERPVNKRVLASLISEPLARACLRGQRSPPAAAPANGAPAHRRSAAPAA